MQLYKVTYMVMSVSKLTLHFYSGTVENNEYSKITSAVYAKTI